MAYDPLNPKLEYFVYQGKCYGYGTRVVFTDYFVQNYNYKGKTIWKYAMFNDRHVVNGKVFYSFHSKPIRCPTLEAGRANWQSFMQCAPFFLLQADLIDIAIERFDHAIVLDIIPEEKRKDFDDAGVMCMWLVYICVLVASLIFKEFYLIWIIASILFFAWRKERLE